ncbi:putative germin-like protein 2-1 [Tanacetum coccineum]
MASRLLLVGLMLATCSLTLASDPSPLQDFCVADLNSKVLVNGVICKDPKDVKAEDFLFRGLQRMGNTVGVKNKREESKKRKKKKIFGVLITQNPAAVFRRSPEFAPSDRHDFWTEASLHIKEGFDRWDLDFEAWKFCFLPGQIASCLVIFFLSCSLFVAIYLDIDSKIMMIVVCL